MRILIFFDKIISVDYPICNPKSLITFIVFIIIYELNHYLIHYQSKRTQDKDSSIMIYSQLLSSNQDISEQCWKGHHKIVANMLDCDVIVS